MQGTVRRVTTASALSNAEGTLGTWAMSLQGFLAEVGVLDEVWTYSMPTGHDRGGTHFHDRA